MIIKGNARRSVSFWAGHLMRADQNERVSIAEIRGLSGDTVKDCLVELDAIAEGTRTTNGFYVASLNPRDHETLTAEQWERAADRLEHELGLDGQARFVVEHEKEGRTHRHVVWSRIDPETMKAIPADFNYQTHEIAARAIEEEMGLASVESVLVKDRGTERPERRPKDYEGFRAGDTKIDPQAMKAELTTLWQAADTGQAFHAALEDAGYILARGDRRDFVVIDAAGDDHSLARRISGAKAAEIRARMADVERDSLPNVAEGRELARAASEGGTSSPASQLDAETEGTPQTAGDTREPTDAMQAAREPAPERNTSRLEAAAERKAEDFTQANDTHPEGGQYERLTPWGRAWRAVSDYATAAADQFREYLRDETSGTPDDKQGPWARLVGAGRKILSGYLHHDGERLADGLEEAKALAIQEALRRLDAAPQGDTQNHAHHPPDEHHRDPERPGENVEPAEPDDSPQGESQAPLDALDEAAQAWMSGGDESGDILPQEDDQPAPEPGAPEPDGWDIEP